MVHPGSAEPFSSALESEPLVRSVLVCGGRDFSDFGYLISVLESLSESWGGPLTVIEGGADGADMLAGCWALKRGHRHLRMKAEWRKYGKHAGPIRNQKMLDKGKPDIVVAFPGGSGTADMVRRAKTAGVRVIEVAPAPSSSAKQTA